MVPWMAGPGSVTVTVNTVGGAPVPVAWVAVLSGDTVVFNTTAGVSYLVAQAHHKKDGYIN